MLKGFKRRYQQFEELNKKYFEMISVKSDLHVAMKCKTHFYLISFPIQIWSFRFHPSLILRNFNIITQIIIWIGTLIKIIFYMPLNFIKYLSFYFRYEIIGD